MPNSGLPRAERERVIGLNGFANPHPGPLPEGEGEQAGKPLPPRYRSALFADDDAEYVEATKDYRLVYKGKMAKEAVLRATPVGLTEGDGFAIFRASLSDEEYPMVSETGFSRLATDGG